MNLYGVMIWVDMDIEERFIYELDIVYNFGNETNILQIKPSRQSTTSAQVIND